MHFVYKLFSESQCKRELVNKQTDKIVIPIEFDYERNIQWNSYYLIISFSVTIHNMYYYCTFRIVSINYNHIRITKWYSRKKKINESTIYHVIIFVNGKKCTGKITKYKQESYSSPLPSSNLCGVGSLVRYASTYIDRSHSMPHTHTHTANIIINIGKNR